MKAAVEPISVAAPGSSDTLTFRRDEHTGHESWVAEVPEFSRPFSRPFYRVYVWKDGWSCSRPDHPLVDDGFTDYLYKTRDFAMQACAEDYVIVARLHRWLEYMKTHEPPEWKGVSGG